MRRTSLLMGLALLTAVLPLSVAAQAQTERTPLAVPARGVEPVILTGAQLPGWSGPPAEGVADPYPNGGSIGERNAHAGTLLVPPPALQTGVDPDSVGAYSYVGDEFVEVPVQVDERFPYFLSNPNSDFGPYSGVDKELTYEWDVESWKKTDGLCEATMPTGASTMEDPVLTLDDDDEVVFMADDAGGKAPLGAVGPVGSGELRQEIRLVDPRDPLKERFVYLFTTASGPTIDESEGYVHYGRDANADEYIDENSFSKSDPEKLGSSNKGYGPNLSGTVCGDDPDTLEIETIRNSSDRFPRDGVTVTTDTYRWRATGRWMVRGMQVTSPGAPGNYGPDLIDRWKGRAFQQSPDSSISLVGFEDEQVNWEGNSALLGELRGPVRAIREVWGADSGTNVTKTETFYRDLITYRYRVRVHPIPPDGLYTSWDYNRTAVATYYNETKTDGVPADGTNDDIGQIDEAPNGSPAFFDAPDPTFTKPLAFLNWEQVSGKDDNGSLVYIFELKNAQGVLNPLVTPYYRDDGCLDDGTGDDPSPRAYPGDSYAELKGKAAEGDQVAADYLSKPCFNEAPEGYSGDYRQGCFACHGIHYLATHDSDNAFAPVPVTEIDGQQYQWAVPTAAPANVGDRYANTVKTPLIPFVSLQLNTPADAPEETSLAISGDMEGQTTDEATLSATLTDADGPVANKEVTFSLDGAPVGKATTSSDGTASVTFRLEGPAREAVQSAAFAGDDSHAASAASAPFEVRHEDSSLTVGFSREPASTTVTARLFETDTEQGLAGRTINFFVNGEPQGAATTDSSGSARQTFPANVLKAGDRVTVAFDGDDTYLGSSAEGEVPKNKGP